MVKVAVKDLQFVELSLFLEAFVYLGFEVVEGYNGKEALEILKEKGENISLIIINLLKLNI